MVAAPSILAQELARRTFRVAGPLPARPVATGLPDGATGFATFVGIPAAALLGWLADSVAADLAGSTASVVADTVGRAASPGQCPADADLAVRAAGLATPFAAGAA